MELTINDYLKGGFNLVIQTNNVNKYEGLLYGKSGYIYLSDSDLKDLETSNNLLELLEKYNNKKEEEYKNERNILS